MTFNGELGLQFTTHIANQYKIPQIIELAELSAGENFSQIWVNDNLGYRNLYVVLTAIATKVPIKIGTAVTVPFYRNPIDFADILASLTELTDGREVSVGIGRGSIAQTGKEVSTPSPYSMLSETVTCVNQLLNGTKINFSDYPLLTSYFNLQEKGKTQMRFSPQAPIKFYLGGYGDMAMEVARKYMNGVLLGGMYLPLLRAGKINELYAKLNPKEPSDRNVDPLLLAEINVSVDPDHKAAMEFPKPYVAHALMTLKKTGFSDSDFQSVGVKPENVIKIYDTFNEGATIQEAAKLVTEEMVNATFIAGDADACIEGLAQCFNSFETQQLKQVVLAKLGPDYSQSIKTLSQDVLPSL